MEIFLGAVIILVWFAVVVWGAADLVIQAKRNKNWEKVGIAALSAATVAGPLLILSPDHVFFGVHTIGLGYALALISVFSIFALLTPPSLRK